MKRVSSILASVGVATSIGHAQVPGFHPVGFTPGTTSSRVTGLSANGAVSAGTSSGVASSGNTIYSGFTWTAEAGRDDFGLGQPFNTAVDAISGDGSAVAGSTGNNAFRYRAGALQQILPIGGYVRASAYGVSGDGAIVVGTMQFPQFSSVQAFRWTLAGRTQALGFARPGDSSSSASAISRDGTTIVGGSGGGSNPGVAYVWRQITGMVALPSLPNSTYGSFPWAVNSDGSIVVGYSGPVPHAALWRDGQVFDLGVPTGTWDGEASGVSDAGTVVVGRAYNATGNHATIWTPTSGMEYLGDYLARNGINVPSDWTLLEATAVSADGLTIAGWGSNAQAGNEGFVVTIPAPSSLLALTAGALVATRRRRPRQA